MAIYIVTTEKEKLDACKTGIRDVFNRCGGSFEESKLERFGIVCVETTAQGAREIAKIPGVKAVEADGVKRVQ